MREALKAAEQLLGRSLQNRYKLEKLLGAGGMGAVFQAHDPRLDRRVAVKIILQSLSRDDEVWKQLLARFWREARITANLRHPNIVSVLDFGEDAKYRMPYLVMELLEGEDLETLLVRERRLPAQRAVPILIQVCEAIGKAHQKQQIHRDLKPSNIFMVKEGRDLDLIKVVDFGLARDEPDPASKGRSLTQTGQVLGTPVYISPEQIELPPGHRLDNRCDIYSLGIVAYHMLAGRPPFFGPSLAAIMNGHLTKKAEPLHGVVPEIPPALSDVIEQSMAKRPADRYSSMSSFCTALRRAMRKQRPPREDHHREATAPGEPRERGGPSGRELPPRASGEPAPDGRAAVEQVQRPEKDVAAPMRAAADDDEARPGELFADVGAGPPLAPQQQTPSAPSAEPAPPARRQLSLADVQSIPVLKGLGRANRPVLVNIGAGLGVVFESDATGRRQIVLQEIDQSLSPRGQPVALTESPCSSLMPAAAGGGDPLYLAWVDTRTGGGVTQVLARAFTSSGEARGAMSECTAEPGLAGSPAAALLPNGKVLVAWHEVGVEPSVVTALLDAEMHVDVGRRRFGIGSNPTVAAGAEGAMLAWHEPDGAVVVCPTKRRREGGTKIDAQGAFPRLAALESGGFGLLWWSSQPAPGIKLTHVTNDGEPSGEVVSVGAATATPERPALIRVDDGFVASWIANGPSNPKHRRLLAAHVSGGLDRVSAPLVLSDEHPARPALLASGRDLLAAWCVPTRWSQALALARICISDKTEGGGDG